eukprot:Filipodium_phascolosomae@DN4787_c0_g1_i1.p1
MGKKQRNKKRRPRKPPHLPPEKTRNSESDQSASVAEPSTNYEDEKYTSPNHNDDVEYGESDDEGNDGYRPGGYHRVQIGDVYKNRYVIIQKLGWGHFSTVWLAIDYEKQQYFAIKFQKSAPHYI